DVELSPPTSPPPDEACAGAPPLAPNVTVPVSLTNHQDDHDTGCLAGAVDAAYELDLPVASDVLLVGHFSSGDMGALELAGSACPPSSQLACGTGSTLVRASKRNVPAGTYRVLVESVEGQPADVTALARPAVPPTQVLFADTCAEAFTIPPT